MKNKMTDLNNHLFSQLERLSDENLTEEEIKKELKRTEGIVKVSEQIISNADLCLKSSKLLLENGCNVSNDFLAIEVKKESQKKIPNYIGK
jgi:hypothetical protein